ncbi:MAG TPA: hypothetical protein VM818_08810 [Vicinamibacterales bacterium]|nr:hypothetical protein [Vicinamibacterales bacterium]
MCPHCLGRALPFAALLIVALLVVSIGAQVRPSRQDAEAMKRKVATIQAHGEQSSKQPRRTTVTESEVNSYIAYELNGTLPEGVVNPSVMAPGEGRVSGRAVVDLDAVRKAGKSTGLLDLRSYLTGSVPVAATGVIHASNGVGRFELESATVGGVPIPKWLLQEIISHYSKSPEHPAGISLDDPFELPARIREIQVQRGLAVVVQ